MSENQDTTSNVDQVEKGLAKTRKTRIGGTGEDSYRPGKTLPTRKRRDLQLHIHVPTSDPGGTDAQWAAARDFFREIAAFDTVGTPVEFGLKGEKFRFVVQLHGFMNQGEDLIVSNAFIGIKPLTDSSPLIKDGFSMQRPHWKIVKGGDFVADEGSF